MCSRCLPETSCCVEGTGHHSICSSDTQYFLVRQAGDLCHDLQLLAIGDASRRSYLEDLCSSAELKPAPHRNTWDSKQVVSFRRLSLLPSRGAALRHMTAHLPADGRKSGGASCSCSGVLFTWRLTRARTAKDPLECIPASSSLPLSHLPRRFPPELFGTPPKCFPPSQSNHPEEVWRGEQTDPPPLSFSSGVEYASILTPRLFFELSFQLSNLRFHFLLPRRCPEATGTILVRLRDSHVEQGSLSLR